MSDPIQMIADKIINEKQQVVLYGAGNDAVLIIRELKRKYSVLPVCICDSDRTKWYKSLSGIKILPFEEALSIYPDLYLFVSAILYKYQIIGRLLEEGKISKERILNFEPVVKRKSCVFVESQLVILEHKCFFCCSDFGKGQSPCTEYRESYDALIDDYLNLRDKLIFDFNHSISTPCDGCPYLFESYFSPQKIIRWIDYSEGGICNFKCCYCHSKAKTNRAEGMDVDLPELLVKLNERDLLDRDLHISVACGEVSINSHRQKIYHSIQGKYNYIFSNSAVYDPQIAILIKHGNSILDTSVDAGTRETYSKVKGIDLFEKVRNNLYHYANTEGSGAIELKYIFLPGLNDNEADVDGFVDFCKFVHPCSIVIAHDVFYQGNLPQKTVNMAGRLEKSLAENGFFSKVVSDKINAASK